MYTCVHLAIRLAMMLIQHAQLTAQPSSTYLLRLSSTACHMHTRHSLLLPLHARTGPQPRSAPCVGLSEVHQGLQGGLFVSRRHVGRAS
jgi:hypothetical protein